MAKIYSHPKEINLPEWKWTDREGSLKAENDFVTAVKEWAKEKTKDKVNTDYIGEELKIQHADGYARYVILSLKPVQLIHLKIGDAWDSPYADVLTKKKIVEMIDNDRKWAKAWEKAKKK